MPIILDKKISPLYKEEWNEAWSEAMEKRINDAIKMIKKFNLPIDIVAKELNIILKH